MDAATRRAIEWDIERLGIAYAKHIDFGEYEPVASMFLPDGELSLMGNVFHGPQEVLAFLEARPRDRVTQHVLSNCWIKVLDDKQAEGITYLTLYRYQADRDHPPLPVPLETPALVGYYTDRYALVDGAWRFARRALTIQYQRAEG
jgi:hypothetical protein